jgi:hypothetical protein
LKKERIVFTPEDHSAIIQEAQREIANKLVNTIKKGC